jgi:hypothetical protein
MDFSNIINLLPEFLELFKGKDGESGLQDILSSAGNSDMLGNILKNTEKYTKYLPLLPLLSKLSKEGLTGLLTNADDVSSLLSVIGQSENKYARMLRNLDAASLARLLTLISEFFGKTQEKNGEVMDIASPKEEKKEPCNPLSHIAEIADKDILYALNRYISR